MKTLTCIVGAGTAVLLALFPVRPGTAAAGEEPAGMRAAPKAETFDVDPVHSSVVFRVKHLDVSWFYGRFNEVSGRFTLDPADPEKSRVEVSVKADSLDTGNERRDRDLKGQHFFNVKQFPTITFKSTAVESKGDGRYLVAGDLTLRGVTKSISVDVERVGEGTTVERFGRRAGYHTSFTIDRTDFGMSAMADNKALGRRVKLIIALEGTPAE